MAFENDGEALDFALLFVLGRVPNTAFKAAWRKLDEREQRSIATTVREYLILANWRFSQGAPLDDNKPASADPYEAAIEDAIATCGGEARAAVKALLVANEFLESELRILHGATSTGFSRGRLAKKAN